MSLSKKGFMITPIIFIAFFLIAVIFSFYVSDVDREIAYGVQKGAAVEKGVHDLQKERINQITFVKVSVYKCSKVDPCNLTNIVPCAKGNLTEIFGSDLDLSITNMSNIIYANFNMSGFNATNINMTSDNVMIQAELNKELLGC
jgi:hypothetical protein